MGDQPLGTPLKNPFTWLHLADVRFGAKDSLAAESMWDALEGDVFTALPKDDLKPQAVFLTGSITATGTEPDFAMAEKRFARWVRILGLDPKTRWFVSPGPGDVDREALTDFERRFRYSFQSREEENKSLAEAETWKLFSKRQTAFLAFTERFLGRRRAWAREQPWAVDRLELDHGVNGATVAILSLNGSWACQDAQDPGNLLLGEVQVDSLLRGARDVSLKIGLLSQDWDDFKRFDGKACQQRLTGRDGVHFLLQTGSAPAIQSNNDPGFTYHVFRGGDRTKEGPTAMIGQADLESGKGRIDAWSYDSQRRFWHKANHFYRDMQNGSWSFTWNPNPPKSAQPAAAAGLEKKGPDQTAKSDPSKARRREAEPGDGSAHSQHNDKERKIATKPEASPGGQVRAQIGATDYQPGQMIGPHYEVIERLGAGASGVVYKVRSLDGDIEALKLSKADMFHSDKSRRRFIRELRTARQLSHDRLVPLFNLEYLPKGAVFYTMKFMSGGDLSRKLAEAVRTDSHLKLQQVLTWMGQVAEALAYIHKKGMVHQDVKPGNILLGEDNEAYLGDFGLIFKYLSPNSLDSLSETRTRVGGSPQFMSPEQQKVVFYQRETKITAASDSYSFGLTLYALLTGEMGGRTDPLASFLGETPLTQKLDAFLVRCLQHDPGKRFANGTELSKALKNLLVDGVQEENRLQASIREGSQGFALQDPILVGKDLVGVVMPNQPNVANEQPTSQSKPQSESVSSVPKKTPAKIPAAETESPNSRQKETPPNAASSEPSSRETELPKPETKKPKEKKDWTTLAVIPLTVALIGLVPFFWDRWFQPQPAKYWVKDPHVTMNEPLVIHGNETAGQTKSPLHIKLGDFMYAEAAERVNGDPPRWQFIPGELPVGTEMLAPGTYELHVGAQNQAMLELTKVTLDKADLIKKRWALVKEVVDALDMIASGQDTFAQNINLLGLKNEVMAARQSYPEGIPREVYQNLQGAALKGLGTPFSTAKQRQALGLALGRLGDPRLGLEKRERWVALPAETFTMGNNQSHDEGEKPAHKVKLTQPFWIGRYPVTNEEFREFVDGGDYKSFLQSDEQPSYWDDEQFKQPNQPVVGVSWHGAEAFCRWLTARFEANPPEWWKPGMSFSLPSEAQWEYAARGESERAFPWGSEKPNHERANFSRYLNQTNAVGIYPKGATPEGVSDMAGGTWEWCLDTYDKDAFKGRAEITEDPVVLRDKPVRVLRGGSWGNPAECLAASYRDGDRAGLRNDHVGFRLVVLLPSEHGH